MCIICYNYIIYYSFLSIVALLTNKVPNLINFDIFHSSKINMITVFYYILILFSYSVLMQYSYSTVFRMKKRERRLRRITRSISLRSTDHAQTSKFADFTSSGGIQYVQEVVTHFI